RRAEGALTSEEHWRERADEGVDVCPAEGRLVDVEKAMHPFRGHGGDGVLDEGALAGSRDAHDRRQRVARDRDGHGLQVVGVRANDFDAVFHPRSSMACITATDRDSKSRGKERNRTVQAPRWWSARRLETNKMSPGPRSIGQDTDRAASWMTRRVSSSSLELPPSLR